MDEETIRELEELGMIGAGGGGGGGGGGGDGKEVNEVGMGAIDLMNRIMRESAAERAAVARADIDGGDEMASNGGRLDVYEDEDEDDGEENGLRLYEPTEVGPSGNGMVKEGMTWKERQLKAREEAQAIVEKVLCDIIDALYKRREEGQ